MDFIPYRRRRRYYYVGLKLFYHNLLAIVDIDALGTWT